MQSFGNPAIMVDMRPDTIVAYTYDAEQLCPACTVAALLKRFPFNGPFEGHDRSDRNEWVLDTIADAIELDRSDEHSFDSGDFPKVVFADMVEDDEPCDGCHEDIIGLAISGPVRERLAAKILAG